MDGNLYAEKSSLHDAYIDNFCSIVARIQRENADNRMHLDDAVSEMESNMKDIPFSEYANARIHAQWLANGLYIIDTTTQRINNWCKGQK